jgi:hypothetical protein
MRRNRTGPATAPASGEAPASTVFRARAQQEREPAAERGATVGGRGVGLLAGGQAASTMGDACYAVALPWYVLTGHGGAAALGTFDPRETPGKDGCAARDSNPEPAD